MIRNVMNFFLISFFLWSSWKMIKPPKRKNEKTKETTNNLIKTIFEALVFLIFFCLFLIINTKDDDSRCFYFFVVFVFFIVGLFALIEAEKSNSYMVNYLFFTLVYIEMITIASFLIPLIGGVYYTKNDQVNPEFLLILSFWVMISMIAMWCLYFLIPKRMNEKYKNIDLINLKTLFLKSTFQSITTFIALYGLAGSGLPNFYKTFALFINATAAFSYPILDMNKYLREKEIEQNEIDRRYEPIKPNIKLKK